MIQVFFDEPPGPGPMLHNSTLESDMYNQLEYRDNPLPPPVYSPSKARASLAKFVATGKSTAENNVPQMDDVEGAVVYGERPNVRFVSFSLFIFYLFSF